MIGPEEGGSGALLGYCMVAAGAVDILAAVMLLLLGKPADPKLRKNLALVIGLAGFGMIALGALFWMGVLGGG